MKKILASLIFWTGLVPGGPVFAGQCGYDYCWGAVSIGPRGEWAWSTGYMAENGAVAKIQSTCSGCTEIEAFYNGCGAIVQGVGGAWGFGWGETRAQAERAAIGYCSGYESGCKTVVWSCSY